MDNITTSIVATNGTEAPDTADYILSNWYNFIWLTLFWLVAIAGTIGNSVVIWIVVAHKNMRTVTNMLLLNLSVADGLLSSLNIPFVSYQLLIGYWPFGSAMCKVNEFIATTSICISVLTLSMIAIDRYRAVMHPFKLRMGRGKIITIMLLTWIVSIVVSSPNWIYVRTTEFANGIIICAQIWPKKSPETLYNVLYMILTYFLPLTCMTYSYGRMGSLLWGSKSIGEKSENQMKNDLAKQKVVKMMIVIVVIFTICWLPFHLFFILNSADLLNNMAQFINQIYVAAFWFAMSNSMYNPMVYCWMNARFRAGFKKAFRWCPGVNYDAALDEIHFSSGPGRKSEVVISTNSV